MKKSIVFFLSLLTLSLSAHCRIVRERWDFRTLEGWHSEHQDTARVSQVSIEEGNMRIFTRPWTRDRQKMFTNQRIYTSGTYTWRTFVPPVAPGEQVSVGSWIYHNDHHELDFEVGYGTNDARRACGAGPKDLVAYMTNQDLPYVSSGAAIRPGWHVFSIRLLVRDGKYLAQWLIDSRMCQEQQLQFGPEIAFYICCSVENLWFTGETIPHHYYYGLFDYVTFRGQTAPRP